RRADCRLPSTERRRLGDVPRGIGSSSRSEGLVGALVRRQQRLRRRRPGDGAREHRRRLEEGGHLDRAALAKRSQSGDGRLDRRGRESLMRTVIFGGATTLDGYFARVDHSTDWILWSDEIARTIAAIWKRVDTCVMGRKTYEVGLQKGHWDSLPM